MTIQNIIKLYAFSIVEKYGLHTLNGKINCSVVTFARNEFSIPA